MGGTIVGPHNALRFGAEQEAQTQTDNEQRARIRRYRHFVGHLNQRGGRAEILDKDPRGAFEPTDGVQELTIYRPMGFQWPKRPPAANNVAIERPPNHAPMLLGRVRP